MLENHDMFKAQSDHLSKDVFSRGTEIVVGNSCGSFTATVFISRKTRYRNFVSVCVCGREWAENLVNRMEYAMSH